MEGLELSELGVDYGPRLLDAIGGASRPFSGLPSGRTQGVVHNHAKPFGPAQQSPRDQDLVVKKFLSLARQLPANALQSTGDTLPDDAGLIFNG